MRVQDISVEVRPGYRQNASRPIRARRSGEAAPEELVEIVRELRERPIRPRLPHQIPEAQTRNAVHHGAVPRFTV